jgi:hypothetical protein
LDCSRENVIVNYLEKNGATIALVNACESDRELKVA